MGVPCSPVRVSQGRSLPERQSLCCAELMSSEPDVDAVSRCVRINGIENVSSYEERYVHPTGMLHLSWHRRDHDALPSACRARRAGAAAVRPRARPTRLLDQFDCARG